MKRATVFCAALLAAVVCGAQAPQLINYQGRLLNGTNLANGSVGLSLRLYNVPAGGSSVYEDSNSVTVVDGLYSTLIGDNTVSGSLPAALTNPAVYVEAMVNGVALAPREQVAAAAYALVAAQLDAVGSSNLVRRTGDTMSGALNNQQSVTARRYFNAMNSALGPESIALGGSNNTISASSPYATIAGGNDNNVAANSTAATIGGGWLNDIGRNATNSTIGGGYNNSIGTNARFSVIGGGYGNDIEGNASYAILAGGYYNIIHTNASMSTIGGGDRNYIGDNSGGSTVTGGVLNDIGHHSTAATVAGGQFNSIGTNADFSFIGGGEYNVVSNNARFAFAAGQRARANHSGAFVWGDNSTIASIASTNTNSVTFRAAGGYRFFSNSGATLGAALAPNATAWAALSDRNAKENFEPIDAGAILEKLAALPVTAWSYKTDPDHRRYIGPTAQDFHAAFGLGGDTTINTLDADGVALASDSAVDGPQDVRTTGENG